MIKKNNVVQFTENHKWVGCFGYVTEIRVIRGRMRYMIGVPLPMQGTAYIFDDGKKNEKVGTAVLVPAESEKGEEE